MRERGILARSDTFAMRSRIESAARVKMKYSRREAGCHAGAGAVLAAAPPGEKQIKADRQERATEKPANHLPLGCGRRGRRSHRVLRWRRRVIAGDVTGDARTLERSRGHGDKQSCWI